MDSETENVSEKSNKVSFIKTGIIVALLVIIAYFAGFFTRSLFMTCHYPEERLILRGNLSGINAPFTNPDKFEILARIVKADKHGKNGQTNNNEAKFSLPGNLILNNNGSAP